MEVENTILAVYKKIHLLSNPSITTGIAIQFSPNSPQLQRGLIIKEVE